MTVSWRLNKWRILATSWRVAIATVLLRRICFKLLTSTIVTISIWLVTIATFSYQHSMQVTNGIFALGRQVSCEVLCVCVCVRVCVCVCVCEVSLCIDINMLSYRHREKGLKAQH